MGNRSWVLAFNHHENQNFNLNMNRNNNGNSGRYRKKRDSRHLRIQVRLLSAALADNRARPCRKPDQGGGRSRSWILPLPEKVQARLD